VSTERCDGWDYAIEGWKRCVHVPHYILVAASKTPIKGCKCDKCKQ
jgi:hypothetical protein